MARITNTTPVPVATIVLTLQTLDATRFFLQRVLKMAAAANNNRGNEEIAELLTLVERSHDELEQSHEARMPLTVEV